MKSISAVPQPDLFKQSLKSLPGMPTRAGLGETDQGCPKAGTAEHRRKHLFHKLNFIGLIGVQGERSSLCNYLLLPPKNGGSGGVICRQAFFY